MERGYNDRGWTCFESSESRLIKPDTLCMDLGRFTIDKVYACADFGLDDDGLCQGMKRKGKGQPLRIGAVRFAERTVAELANEESPRATDYWEL